MAKPSKTSTIDFSSRPVSGARQTNIFYDRFSYSAFPHVIRLEGDELLIAFRQAPREKTVRHTHPRSVVTLIRSYDGGQTWDIHNAGQMAAGGGQELGLIYLGHGKVGGALAAHEVVPVNEAVRSGFSYLNKHEYPFNNVGSLWCWSDNFGLTWRVENTLLVGDGLQACAPPVRLSDNSLMIPSYGNIGRSKISSAVVHRSEDGGATWSESVIMARGTPQTRHYHEPVILELAPGHLLGMLRFADNGQSPSGIFWQNESLDNGKTWSTPRATHVRSGACPRLLTLRDGRLLLTYGRRFEPFGIYASFSEDKGKTWSETAWLLRPTPDSDQGYTSSVEMDDGRIFTTSYARNGHGITGITGTFWNLP